MKKKIRKNIFILGSTGTIGINTLKVVERYPEKFNVVGLTAYTNDRLLERQIKKFSPDYVAVTDKVRDYLKKNITRRQFKIFDVDKDLEYLVSLKTVDIIIIGMRSSAALGAFLSAVRSGKVVAPANKEALVIAGEILMKEAKRYNAKILPIDSEQSAIFQCLQGNNRAQVKKIYLTASGGTLLNVPKSRFDKLSISQILKHPRWKMGKKITVDSASLMNKGFEVIEAKNLFSLDVKDIQIIIHPEAIIHSMVEFKDGSIIAQLGIADMRLPIQYALTYPDRYESGLKAMDFFELKRLNFSKPNFEKFPALALANHVARKGGTLPSVLNAADEEAVGAFLDRKIPFSRILKVVDKVVMKHKTEKNPGIRKILQADAWAREQAKAIIQN